MQDKQAASWYVENQWALRAASIYDYIRHYICMYLSIYLSLSLSIYIYIYIYVYTHIHAAVAYREHVRNPARHLLWGRSEIPADAWAGSTVSFRNSIVLFWAETLAH